MSRFFVCSCHGGSTVQTIQLTLSGSRLGQLPILTPCRVKPMTAPVRAWCPTYLTSSCPGSQSCAVLFFCFVCDLRRGPVLARLCLKKCSNLLLRTFSTRRNALSLKFLQRRRVPPFPSNYSHEKRWPTWWGKGPHHRPPQCSSKQILKEIDSQLSSEGPVIHFLPFDNKTRLESKPATSPFNFK